MPAMKPFLLKGEAAAQPGLGLPPVHPRNARPSPARRASGNGGATSPLQSPGRAGGLSLSNPASPPQDVPATKRRSTGPTGEPAPGSAAASPMASPADLLAASVARGAGMAADAHLAVQAAIQQTINGFFPSLPRSSPPGSSNNSLGGAAGAAGAQVSPAASPSRKLGSSGSRALGPGISSFGGGGTTSFTTTPPPKAPVAATPVPAPVLGWPVPAAAPVPAPAHVPAPAPAPAPAAFKPPAPRGRGRSRGGIPSGMASLLRAALDASPASSEQGTDTGAGSPGAEAQQGQQASSGGGGGGGGGFGSPAAMDTSSPGFTFSIIRSADEVKHLPGFAPMVGSTLVGGGGAGGVNSPPTPVAVLPRAPLVEQVTPSPHTLPPGFTALATPGSNGGGGDTPCTPPSLGPVIMPAGEHSPVQVYSSPVAAATTGMVSLGPAQLQVQQHFQHPQQGQPMAMEGMLLGSPVACPAPAMATFVLVGVQGGTALAVPAAMVGEPLKGLMPATMALAPEGVVAPQPAAVAGGPTLLQLSPGVASALAMAAGSPGGSNNSSSGAHFQVQPVHVFRV